MQIDGEKCSFCWVRVRGVVCCLVGCCFFLREQQINFNCCFYLPPDGGWFSTFISAHHESVREKIEIRAEILSQYLQCRFFYDDRDIIDLMID